MPDDTPPPPPGPPDSRTAHWHPALRFLLLNVGLLAYGVGLAAMIQARVGLAPWDALHVGLSRHVPGLTVGWASVGVGFVCQVAAWRLLAMPIGLGSVLNMLLIGGYIDLFSPRIPAPANPVVAWALFLGGIAVSGFATGTYIASHFGAGPRDSVVLGLARRTGWPIKRLRTLMEVSVLALGWAMGAQIGWGTLVFALTFGPAMSLGLGVYGLKR